MTCKRLRIVSLLKSDSTLLCTELISNRRAIQRCNVSSVFYAKICSLLARRRSSQPVQRVYWPENVIDWLGKWRPTCVMRHARGQKLQSFRRKWPFCMDLYSVLLCGSSLICIHQKHKIADKIAIVHVNGGRL
jgi:hypothetical protein